MRPGEISKSSGILIKPQYMFTFNLRCVPLGLSQTSWATPSHTQFCSLCIGGSEQGEWLSKAFRLDGLTLELPSCFVLYFFTIIVLQGQTLTHFSCRGLIKFYLCNRREHLLILHQIFILILCTLYHSIGLLNATDIFLSIGLNAA